MSYSTSNPGHGNLPEIHGFSVNQTSRVTHTASVSSGLSAIVNSQASSSWQAASATAWRERAGRVLTMLDESSQVAHGWAAASRNYQSALESLATQAAAANHKIDTAHHMLHAYAQMPVEITSTPHYVANAHAYDSDIREGHQTLQYLEGVRYADDATCVNALNARGPAGSYSKWNSLQQLYGDAKSVEDIRAVRADLVATNNALGRKVLSGDASTEDIDALAKFLAASSGDPALAAQFWDNFKGYEATDLLYAGVSTQLLGGQYGVDYSVSETGLAFAHAIRSSLAAASGTWDQATAESFATEMYTRNGDVPPSSRPQSPGSEIGYLFDDAANNPMGARFTVAMANLFDADERASGYGFGVDARVESYHRMQEMSGDEAGISTNALWFTEGNGGPNMDHQAIDDPMSRVLDTLGTYPDAAWDWLSSTDPGASDGTAAGAPNRVDYYSSRDWSNDGFDGFGALWDGSMQAEGGLNSPTYSELVWDSQCDVASRIVANLDSSAYFDANHLSEAGGGNLSKALAQLLPYAEYEGWTTRPAPDPGEPQLVDRGVDPDRAFVAGPDHRRIPYLPPTTFGDVLAVAVSSDQGFVNIRHAATQVGNELILNADAEAGAHPDKANAEWNSALIRYSKLEASFEAVAGGADILQARLDDAGIRAQMSAATFALSFLPSSGLGTIVDIGIGQAAGAGTDALTNYFASNERTALSRVDGSVQAGAAGVAATIERLSMDPNFNFKTTKAEAMGPEEWYGTFTAENSATGYATYWMVVDGS